jgi:hypothetical protein
MEYEIGDYHDLIEDYIKSSNKSRSLFLIKSGLDNKVIDPDKLLLAVIPQIKKVSNLILVAFAVRAGANVNQYVEVIEIGQVHLLIYTVMKIREAPLQSVTLYTLKLLGAKFEMPVSLAKSTPVADWLRSKKIVVSSINNTRVINIITNTDVKVLMTLSELRLAIESRIVGDQQGTILSKTINVYQTDHAVNLVLKMAIEEFNLEAFVFFLDQGIQTNYFLINELTLLIQHYYKQSINPLSSKKTVESDKLILNCYRSMLLEAIKRGAILDVEQLTTLAATNSNEQVLDEYHHPAWKKMCYVTKGDVPHRLRNLGFYLNLPSASKEEICQEIVKLAVFDGEKLKESVVARQQERLSANVSSISDFLNGPSSEPKRGCQNKGALQKDPYAYNDAQVSFYRDDQNSVWCFTSDLYESLLSKKINPHSPTAEKLPQEFLDTIKMRLELMKTLGISASNPISTVDAIDQLSTIDQITSEASDNEVLSLEHIASFTTATAATTAKSGLSGGGFSGGSGGGGRSLRSLSTAQMIAILETLKLQQPYFDEMSSNHQYITFCRLGNFYIKLNPPVNAQKLFTVISQYS